MPVKKKIVRVLIADDQTLFREGIKDVLTGEKWIEVVGEAADGEEAVALTKKLKPEVVLMDIKLPKLDGIAATRQIKKSVPEVNVLMLSSFEDEAHVMEAIQAGANGYLSKMLPAAELVNSIRTFTSEGLMIPQQLMGKLLQGLRKIKAPHPLKLRGGRFRQGAEIKAFLFLVAHGKRAKGKFALLALGKHRRGLRRLRNSLPFIGGNAAVCAPERGSL